MTVAKLVSPLFELDGVYRMSAAGVTGAHATLLIVQGGALYAVSFKELDDPAALRRVLSDPRVTLERIG